MRRVAPAVVGEVLGALRTRRLSPGPSRLDSVQLRQPLDVAAARPQSHSLAPDHRPPDPPDGLRAVRRRVDSVAGATAHHAPADPRLGTVGVGVVVTVIHWDTVGRGCDGQPGLVARSFRLHGFSPLMKPRPLAGNGRDDVDSIWTGATFHDVAQEVHGILESAYTFFGCHGSESRPRSPTEALEARSATRRDEGVTNGSGIRREAIP